MKATLEIEDKNYSVTLDESSEAVQDLISRMPLTVNFTDFPPNERIGKVNPTLNLPETRIPAHSRAGDICFSIPFENICLFVQDFNNTSKSLIHLGEIDDGVDALLKHGSEFTAVFKKK